MVSNLTQEDNVSPSRMGSIGSTRIEEDLIARIRIQCTHNRTKSQKGGLSHTHQDNLTHNSM